MKLTWSIPSFNKGWGTPWCLGESRFHSDSNIAAMKSEVQRETGAVNHLTKEEMGNELLFTFPTVIQVH